MLRTAAEGETRPPCLRCQFFPVHCTGSAGKQLLQTSLCLAAMVITSCGYRLPFWTQSWQSLIQIIILCHTVPQHCGGECSSGAYGERSVRWASSLQVGGHGQGRAR